MIEDAKSNGVSRSPDLEAAVTAFARAHPQLGQARAAAALRARGIIVSASGVRYLWGKHGLETRFKRLKAIERVQGRGVALTEQQREIVRRGDTARRFARRSRASTTGGHTGVKARRDLILTAASELFVERGYAGTSMRDIAAKVGLFAGSVYHYYPAKENLFLAVQREGFRQIIDRVERAIAQETRSWERLELACAEHIHSVVSGDPISRITAIGLFAIHEDALQRHLKRDHDRYESIFRRLIDALPLGRGTDRSMLRLTLFGAMNWTLVWYRPGGKTTAEIARQIVGLLRRGSTPQATIG